MPTMTAQQDASMSDFWRWLYVSQKRPFREYVDTVADIALGPDVVARMSHEERFYATVYATGADRLPWSGLMS